MREMKVTGHGRLSVKPDRIRLILNLSDTKKDYEKALQASAELGAKLTELFQGCGFEAEDLKTTNFFVDAQYEGYNDKDGNWKQRFVGYRFEQSLKIEFPIDNDRLGKILYALAKSGVKTEFRIQYTVEDPEACRKELLDGAVKDAKEKAAVLAKASGVKLGEIIRVDYSFGDREIYSEPVNFRNMKCYGAAECEDSTFAVIIVADNIDLNDTVTICYEMV